MAIFNTSNQDSEVDTKKKIDTKNNTDIMHN